jgi:hypothetical protein
MRNPLKVIATAVQHSSVDLDAMAIQETGRGIDLSAASMQRAWCKTFSQ